MEKINKNILDEEVNYWTDLYYLKSLIYQMYSQGIFQKEDMPKVIKKLEEIDRFIKLVYGDKHD